MRHASVAIFDAATTGAGLVPDALTYCVHARTLASDSSAPSDDANVGSMQPPSSHPVIALELLGERCAYAYVY